MKKQKSFTKTSILVSLTFYLFGCTVIDDTSLPSFSAVEDSENVLAFYDNCESYDDYYDYSDNDKILFFNTKTEKITKEWTLKTDTNNCIIAGYVNTSIIDNEVYFSSNNKYYHVRKDSGKNIPLKCNHNYATNIKSFFDNTVLIDCNDESSVFIYDPKNNSYEKTNIKPYDYNSYFELNGERYYVDYSSIYSCKNAKKVYSISSEDDYSYYESFFDKTNFYEISDTQEISNEDINTIIKVCQLKEIAVDENGDFYSVTVANTKMNRSSLALFKNSDTQITFFESDRNDYLYVSTFKKENGVWSEANEKINKDNKIKIDSSWIEEQNGAYWLKNNKDNMIRISKDDFTTKEIKL